MAGCLPKQSCTDFLAFPLCGCKMITHSYFWDKRVGGRKAEKVCIKVCLRNLYAVSTSVPEGKSHLPQTSCKGRHFLSVPLSEAASAHPLPPGLMNKFLDLPQNQIAVLDGSTEMWMVLLWFTWMNPQVHTITVRCPAVGLRVRERCKVGHIIFCDFSFIASMVIMSVYLCLCITG